MKTKSLTTNLNSDFIQRTLKTTGIVLLFTFLIGLYYFGLYPSLAYLSAGVWSMLNLMFLTALVRKALHPDKIDKITVAGLAFIKFPLLYGAAYFLFTVEIFQPVPLFIGLSMVILIMVTKAVSRAMLNLDVVKQENSSRGLA